MDYFSEPVLSRDYVDPVEPQTGTAKELKTGKYDKADDLDLVCLRQIAFGLSKEKPVDYPAKVVSICCTDISSSVLTGRHTKTLTDLYMLALDGCHELAIIPVPPMRWLLDRLAHMYQHPYSGMFREGKSGKEEDWALLSAWLQKPRLPIE